MVIFETLTRGKKSWTDYHCSSACNISLERSRRALLSRLSLERRPVCRLSRPAGKPVAALVPRAGFRLRLPSALLFISLVPKPGTKFRCLVLVSILPYLGCSLATDSDTLVAGDAGLGCLSGEKICPVNESSPDGQQMCVGDSDWTHGCAKESCAPCQVRGANPQCLAGECVARSCKENFGDCIENERGCETDLRFDLNHCGACDSPCAQDNTIFECSSSQCVLVYCSEKHFADCDLKVTNGCETDTRTDRKHCGNCGNSCSTTCNNGVCEALP